MCATPGKLFLSDGDAIEINTRAEQYLIIGGIKITQIPIVKDFTAFFMFTDFPYKCFTANFKLVKVNLKNIIIRNESVR